jgi:competence protein ComEC
MRYALILLLVLVSLHSVMFADVVTPTDDVVTRVIVRQSPSGQSAQVGSLTPGQEAELVGSVPNWYEVRLANGLTGFVPKRWTRVIGAGPTPPPPPPMPIFIIDVVDVGTGLAVLVRGDDFALVYDAGSNDDQAKGSSNRMLAYLKLVAPTLTTIDHVILSHPHTDHVELMADLFGAYTVRQVWDSGPLNDVCGYRALVTAIRNQAGVQYHNTLQDLGTSDYAFVAKFCDGVQLQAATVTLTLSSVIVTGSPITLGQNASMTILHANGDSQVPPNANSLVVRMDLGPTRVLFMGDAEAGGRKLPSNLPSKTSIEGKLLDCCTSDLAANVLIVGHHGSLTSSRKALLDAVSPTISVVSSGPKKYGTVVLPDMEIITTRREWSGLPHRHG